MKIISAPDYAGMSRKAANLLSAQVILFPRSVLGLATGSTPLGVYRQLVEWYRKGDVDFSQAASVNLDEYCGLAKDHPQSYRRYMEEHFFSQVNFDPAATHLPDGLAPDREEECRRYDALIAALGGIDMQVLGLGHNGHIGFNEPGDDFNKTTHVVELKDKTRQANARFFASLEEVPRQAITMGIKAIMQAKKILLVASGESKAAILHQALFGPVYPAVPASILQLHPDVTVVADEAALRVIREKEGERWQRSI